MTTVRDVLDEVRRVEANTGLRVTLATRKRVKAEHHKKWETIRALRIHLEKRFNDGKSDARDDET